MIFQQKSSFIIPFLINSEVKDTWKIFKESKIWNTYCQPKENELHTYITRRFLQDESMEASCICKIYEVDKNAGKQYLKTLYDKVYNKCFKLFSIRMYLYNTGLSFAVFGIEYDDDFDLNETIELNSIIKDLYSDSKRFYTMEGRIKLVEDINITPFSLGSLVTEGDPNDHGIQRLTLIENDNRISSSTVLYKNKSTGEYIRNTSDYFFAISNKEINLLKARRNVLYDCLQEMLGDLNVSSKDNYCFWGTANKNTPKKAHICSYYLVDDSNYTEKNIFHLMHGYGMSYYYTEDMECQSFSPFGNTKWGVAREGLACLGKIGDNDTTNIFLKDTFPIRVDRVYLWIYIMILHQYYGLQYYSMLTMEMYQESTRRIEKVFKSKVYKSIANKMKKVTEAANLFYLQNCYTDISQISHQNLIYRMLYEEYNIDAMIEDFSENITLCNTFINNKFSDKLSNRINLVAWITGLTGIYEIYKDVRGMIEGTQKLLAIPSIWIIIAFVIIMLSRSIYIMVKRNQ